MSHRTTPLICTSTSCFQDGHVFFWSCDNASGYMWSPKLHKFNDVWHVSWSLHVTSWPCWMEAVRWTCEMSQLLDGQWMCMSDVNTARVLYQLQSQGGQNKQTKPIGPTSPVWWLRYCTFWGQWTKQLGRIAPNSNKIISPRIVSGSHMQP